METKDPISLEGALAQRYRLMEAQWLMVQFARDKSRWPQSTDELSDWVAALATPPLRLTEATDADLEVVREFLGRRR